MSTVFTTAHPFTSAASDLSATLTIIIFGFIGLIFAFINAKQIQKVPIEAIPKDQMAIDEPDNKSALLNDAEKTEEPEEEFNAEATTHNVVKIHAEITKGAYSFLFAEYKYMFAFILMFSVVIIVLVGSAGNCGGEAIENGILIHTSGPCWINGVITAISFAIGGSTSILSGFVGMVIAVYANARTTCAAQHGWSNCFNVAFRAGAVMGFCLCGLALLVLFTLIFVVKTLVFPTGVGAEAPAFMFECIAGYGLGGSSIALFGRVGGGIYTKAADVGADLVGKVEQGMNEDDPRNPATIADNVGDNVGDVAGMGADLFGSFAESTCAALVVISTSPDLNYQFPALMFPLIISAVGIGACLLTSFFATDIFPVKNAKGVEDALRIQMIASTIITTLALIPAAWYFLPSQYCVALSSTIPSNTNFSWVGLTAADTPDWCLLVSYNYAAYICVVSGLWGGLIIGYFTDYMTSNHHAPVIELAHSCQEGAAVNIIYGMSLGNFSCIVPGFALAIAIYFSFYLSDMLGVAFAALGMLSTLSIGLTIDAYGPVCDNAGGIAEMAEFPAEVRERTDILDAAGNTTAAIGKGFAIGSAALVSLALFGAFVTRVGLTSVNILKPITFAGLLIGAMLPYWFSAMCLRSVGKAAKLMVGEVRRQFAEIPGLLTGEAMPETERCVRISTEASLREMMGPGVLVMGTPIIMGFLFGVNAVTGLLAGGMVSGVQMAISSSNMGGAWDNAKKYVEAGNLGGKGTPTHAAAVIGDTVGDPLKDTSGPSLNILMKLMAIISLVFADFFNTKSLPVLLNSTAF